MIIHPTETQIPFEPFAKIPRIKNNGAVITEKIDGTNAQLLITEDGNILAGSRSRWLYPGKQSDNYGFAAWATDNHDELLKIGPGRHYGEWWGSGVQRGYGILNGEKRFSLFNTERPQESLPACVSVVPVLYRGEYHGHTLATLQDLLVREGSVAAPGFMKPEGMVVYFFQSRQLFKHIINGDKPSKNLRSADDLLPCEVGASS